MVDYSDSLMLGVLFEGYKDFYYLVRGIRPDAPEKAVAAFAKDFQTLESLKIIDWQVIPYDEKLWRRRRSTCRG